MSTSTFNRHWAAVLIEALTRHGVRHICIAPGSRSAPLTLEAASNRKLVCHTHFDERGLGHLALGLAKGSHQPVAIIVTSGTAVANLYPAVIEASLTGEKLVLLTADRPPELIDCGANQAIDQIAIFAGYVRALNLPRPDPEISARWLVSAVDNLLSQSGVIQINCPFAEPLYGDEEDQEAQPWRDALGDWWQGTHCWLEHMSYQNGQWLDDEPGWQQQRGVVIAGRLRPEEGLAVAEWAETLGWPLISDVQSHTGQPLPCADLWLAQPEAQRILSQAQRVVQFGCSLTSKRLLQWQAHSAPAAWWLIDRLPGRRDPACHCGRRIVADPLYWLQQHPVSGQRPWASGLSALAARAQRSVATATAQFGEAQVAQRLNELLPAGGQLFLGNSLCIRLVDALACLPAGYPVLANRGASGIDGLISTTAGVQRAAPRPTLLLMGDISALYDLNSLALLRHAPAPLVILIVNNNGGQIFSLLPTPAPERESFFCMPQQVDFSAAAACFGLHYASPDNWPDLQKAVRQCWQHGGVVLIELKTEADAAARTLFSLVTQAGQY